MSYSTAASEVFIDQQLTVSGTDIGSQIAFQTTFTSTVTDTGGAPLNLTGYKYLANHSGGGSNVNLTGLAVETLITGNTDVSSIAGFDFYPDWNNGTGTITNCYGFYSYPWPTTNSLTNFYGIYFDLQGLIGTTLKYGVWVNGETANYLSAGLVIGDGATIGSSSDTNSITIAANGECTFSQDIIWADGTDTIRINEIFIDSVEPTGFENRTDSTLSFNDGTRVFTIDDAGTSFTYYRKGNKVTKTTAQTTTVPDTTQLNYIYFDSNDALQNATSWTFGSGNVLVATVYYDTDTLNEGRIADERHGFVMDAATHHHLHDALGPAYQSGFSLSFADATHTIGAGVFHDEDIEFTIAEQTTSLIVYRQTAGTWTWDTAAAKYYKEDGSSDIMYDNGGTATALGANAYCAYWIFASNDPDAPTWAVMGQETDTTLAAARAGNTFEGLTLTGLPSNELLLLARVILRNDATPYVETEDYRGSFLTGRSTQQYGASNTASGITTDTTNFNAILSVADTNVQLALDTLDDHLHDGQTLQCDAITSDGGAFTFTTSGAVTFTQSVLIQDGGYIGSVSDVDAISISAGGVVTLTVRYR
jgi:hypothetical protein